MSSSYQTEFATARRTLTADLVRYSQIVTDIKRRLNTSTLVDRLPTEVLSEIFLLQAFSDVFCQTSHQGPGGRGGAESLKAYHWLSVAHVCHHWRTIILNLPSFWGRIQLTNPAVVSELLVRSL